MHIRGKKRTGRNEEIMIRINQIKLPVTHDTVQLEQKIKKALKLKADTPFQYQIVKKSIDARKKPELYFVYSIHLCVTMDGKENLKWEQDIIKRNPKSNLQLTEVQPYQLPMSLYTKQIRKPPIIGGFLLCYSSSSCLSKKLSNRFYSTHSPFFVEVFLHFWHTFQMIFST